MPAADIPVDAALARDLLCAQHPDLADLPLRTAAEGWDNVVLRLGGHLAVRLPRRRSAARLVQHEQAVLPGIAARVPVPVPAPVRVGLPSARFPFPWSVVPWFAGTTAAEGGGDELALADALGAFVVALHIPAVDPPANPVRGVPLADRAEAVADRLALLPDAAALRSVWQDALAAPPWSGPPLWLHGDLHPANLIVREGRLAAVVDFGDVTAGDPATDLATAWLSLRPAARARFRSAVPADDATWRRARGWALGMASALVVDGTRPTAAVGRAALGEVLLG